MSGKIVQDEFGLPAVEIDKVALEREVNNLPSRDILERWVDDETGLECALRFTIGGYWCGYVRVPETHRWFMEPEKIESSISVHGSVTYFGDLPDGEKDEVGWWVGFDCAHCSDAIPFLDRVFRVPKKDRVHRTKAFAKREVLKMAKQIKRPPARVDG